VARTLPASRTFGPGSLVAAVAAGWALASCLAPVSLGGPGLRVGFLDDEAFRWSPDRLANLRLADREGATVVRVIVEWAKVAPRRPRHPTDPFAPAYQLDDVDELVRNAHASGLDVLLTIWGTPRWANGGAPENVAPRDARDLRDFARAVAARYSGRNPGLPFVRFFSAWNEPNSALFLSPQFDATGRPVAPRVYAVLAGAVYAGVKSASPAALVAAGETAARGHDRVVAALHDGESPARFAELVAEAAPRLRFDAWAHHPYPSTDLQPPEAPQPWPDVGLSSLGRFETALAQWFHRRAVPLWVTEFGYRTSPQTTRGAPPAVQASYLEQAVMLARAQPHVDMFLWFRFRDVRGQAWTSGVLDARGRPKPALVSFAAAADCFRPAAEPCLEQAKLSSCRRGLAGIRSFGNGVALSADGNTALVGESGADAAWIFTRSGSRWRCGPRLAPDDEDGDARVGSSVALSADGRTAVVGGAADAGGAGAAWVFIRSGDTWTQAGPKLVPTDESGAGRFGGTVAVSADGGTILVGAHGDSDGAGAVWLFAANGGRWAEQGPKLTSPAGSGPVQFGSRVAISADGKTALIGAPADNGGRGAAWIFPTAGGRWSAGVALVPSGEVGAGAFGSSVALSADGGTALVGGPGDGGGAVWTFTRAGIGWREQGPVLRPAAAGAFGTSVALSADGATALVGGPGDSAGAGAGWIFGRARDHWIEEAAKLAPAGTSSAAATGSAAALSGDGGTALLGGPGDSGYAGAAWVFASPRGQAQPPAATYAAEP